MMGECAEVLPAGLLPLPQAAVRPAQATSATAATQRRVPRRPAQTLADKLFMIATLPALGSTPASK